MINLSAHLKFPIIFPFIFRARHSKIIQVPIYTKYIARRLISVSFGLKTEILNKKQIKKIHK